MEATNVTQPVVEEPGAKKPKVEGEEAAPEAAMEVEADPVVRLFDTF